MKVFRAVSIFVFISFLSIGCGSKKTGACIVGSGITAGCGDFTSGQCNIMNGTKYYSNKTCADLGYTD